MSNARGYPPYPPRGKKLHGPSRCRFYTGPPSSRRSRDQDGRDLLYDLHTITGQSEGTHTHATQTKRREQRIVPAVRRRVYTEGGSVVRRTETEERGRESSREWSREEGSRERGWSRGGEEGGGAGTERKRHEEEDDEEGEARRTGPCTGQDRGELFWI